MLLHQNLGRKSALYCKHKASVSKLLETNLRACLYFVHGGMPHFTVQDVTILAGVLVGWAMCLCFFL